MKPKAKAKAKSSRKKKGKTDGMEAKSEPLEEDDCEESEAPAVPRKKRRVKK